MPPLVKEFFPTLTVSEGEVEGKEEKNSSFFLSSALPFFLLEIFNIVKSKCNTRTTKRWIKNKYKCKTAKETQMYRTISWTLWERVRVGWFGRMALKHVYYHMWNRSPVQVRCMRQGARGWCTGMTLRDGMAREVGWGFRMGNTCTPMVDSCQCMAKTTTIL